MSKRDLDDVALEATERLRLARPGDDRVAIDAARARNERALFRTAEPARVGRFVIIDTVAAGGMGVVYRAYDPQLDRKVALKVLRSGDGGDRRARERLLAEARALARLRHPNVVAVHDVVEVDGEIVLVMELIDGQTVAGWLAARSRSWREIVAVFVAAGHGLAAAHALGVVHRDVKPANIVVGDDGRVRVIDFGLAHAAATTSVEAVPPAADRAATEAGARAGALSPVSLTETGAIIGTPAYMAPEQLEGGAPSAAGDQFGFCAALHQALFGVRPFPGDSIDELRDAIRAHRLVVTRATRRIPGRVRALVVRGLAAEPSARHPSMKALIERLERALSRRRWLILAAVAAVAVVGAGAVAIADARRQPASCAIAEDELALVWGPARRTLIDARLRALDAPAPDREAALARLAQHAEDWQRVRTVACRAGLSGVDPAHRQLACVYRARQRLGDATEALAGLDRARVTSALAIVDGLAPMSDCSDPALLLAETEPPPVPVRPVVDAIGRDVDRAEALDRAGRSDEAIALAREALDRAEDVAHPPAIVEAALALGRLLLTRGDWEPAVATLRRAEELALARPSLREAAVEASARRLFAETMIAAPGAPLRGQLELLESLSDGLAAAAFARPLLLLNIGVFHQNQGDREAARRYYERARAARAGLAAPNAELAAIELDLAHVTEDAVAREALARTGWELRREQLGAAHPLTLIALGMYAHFVTEPARALPLASELDDLYARYHPGRLWLRTEAAYHLAFLTAETGDLAGAARRYDEVVALARGATDSDVRAWAALATGHAALVRAQPAAAVPSFAAVIAELGDSPIESDRLLAADARVGAGLAAMRLGDRRSAAAHLEQAERDLAAASAASENMEDHRLLAIARAALVKVRNDRGTGYTTDP